MELKSESERRVVKSQYDESLEAAKQFQSQCKKMSKTEVNGTNVYVESYQQLNSKQEAVIQAEKDKKFVDRQHQFMEEKILSQYPKQPEITTSPNKVQYNNIPENKKKRTRSTSRRAVSREQQHQTKAPQVRFQLAEQDSLTNQQSSSKEVTPSTVYKKPENQKDEVKVYATASSTNIKKYIERIQQLEEEVRLLRQQNQQYEQEKKGLKRQINEQYLELRKYKKMQQEIMMRFNKANIDIIQEKIE